MEECTKKTLGHFWRNFKFLIFCRNNLRRLLAESLKKLLKKSMECFLKEYENCFRKEPRTNFWRNSRRMQYFHHKSLKTFLEKSRGKLLIKFWKVFPRSFFWEISRGISYNRGKNFLERLSKKKKLLEKFLKIHLRNCWNNLGRVSKRIRRKLSRGILGKNPKGIYL